MGSLMMGSLGSASSPAIDDGRAKCRLRAMARTFKSSNPDSAIGFDQLASLPVASHLIFDIRAWSRARRQARSRLHC
jgi:hypothetical protein